MAKTNYDIKSHNEALNTKAEIIEKKLAVDEYGNLEYIVYLLKREKDNGEIVKFYKAIRLFRLTHTSKDAKENKKFMEIHTDIYRAMVSNNIDTIEIIANIKKPQPVGITILYGVQATGNTLQEAVRTCGQNFEAFKSAFTGTHRQCFITPVPEMIMRKIFQMLENQKYVTVVKGIPNTKHSSGDNRNPLSLDTNTEEQIEQLLTGCDDFEYCMMMMMSPLTNKYIDAWLNKTLDRWTTWEKQKQGSFNVGLSIGVPLSLSQNVSHGTSMGRSSGVSSGENKSFSHSENTNKSESVNYGENTSHSMGESHGTNESYGTSKNESNTAGTSQGTSSSHGGSVSVGVQKVVTASAGVNWSNGTNQGSSKSQTFGSGSSESHGSSDGTSENWSSGSSFSKGSSKSEGVSDGSSWGSNTGRSSGINSGSNSSLSAGMSMGMNVGFNFSKGYQWHDMKVEMICELLKTQADRLKMMRNGDGGAYVDIYISTDTTEHQKAVCASASVAWNNANAKIDLMRAEVPSLIEQAKLHQMMLSCSPCLDIVCDPKDKSSYYYKFSTVLATNEFIAYNHPPRITLSGFDNAMNDVPEFQVPTNRQNGEIFIGKVMQPTKFSYDSALKYNGNGFVTDYNYTISNAEMLHAFIAAGSRSGKSVLAQRMVSEMYNKALYTDKFGNVKHRRVLIFDPKGDWRALASLIPDGKFQFYSIGKIGFHNLKLNLMRVPKAVNPVTYVNNLIEMFCNAQGLLQKGKNEFRDVVLGLYKEAHVLENPQDKNWAWEKSKDLTMTDLYNEIMRRKAEAENKRTTGKNTMDAWEAYENRLKMFGDSMYTEYQVFCNKGGDSIEMLLGDDNLTIIESAGLEARTQEFFFTLAMTTIYEYALQFGPKGFYKSEVETVIVIEEANSLIAEKKGEFGNGDAIAQFNTILDKSAGLGLFFWIITQKISEMPKSCIANSGLTFVGRNQNNDDKSIILSTFGYDEKIEYKYKNFLSRMPIGVFIARTARTLDFVSQIPVLIKVSMLKTVTPEDEELDLIIKHHEIERKREENRRILLED